MDFQVYNESMGHVEGEGPRPWVYVLSLTQNLVLSRGRGSGFNERETFTSESREWGKKGKDEGKTGRQGGQDTTGTTRRAGYYVFIYVFKFL